MRRPASLSIVVVLQWVAAVVAIVSGFDLLQAGFSLSKAGVPAALESTLITQGVDDTSGSLIVVGVFMAGVLLIAVGVLRVIIALYLGRGRNWARIVISALVAINLVGGFAYLIQGYTLRASATILIEVVVLWLLFNGRSSAFIKDRSRASA